MEERCKGGEREGGRNDREEGVREGKWGEEGRRKGGEEEGKFVSISIFAADNDLNNNMGPKITQCYCYLNSVVCVMSTYTQQCHCV